jgi:hypothetical protein
MKKLLAIGILAVSSMLAVPAMAVDLFTVNAVLAHNVIHDGYNDSITLDILGIKEIEKHTDGTIETVSKGATLNALGNGGNTTFGTRSIPDALCLKGREWACDGEVMFAITTGAAQSNVYTGDVFGTADVCDISTKTRTHVGKKLLTGYGIDTSESQEAGNCN